MIELSALRSRFGRNLLLLFVGLALAPIFTLALVTYRSMSGELVALREERLKSQAKSQAMAILERLALLEGELALLAGGTSPASGFAIPRQLEDPISLRFSKLSWFTAGSERKLLGGVVERPPLSPAARQHLADGRSLLVLHRGRAGTRILLARAAAAEAPTELWSEIDADYLWWGSYRENSLPPLTELCLVQAELDLTLFCSSGSPARLHTDVRARMLDEAIGELAWSRGGQRHLAHYRTLDLRDLYGSDGFTVLLSEAQSRIGGPLRDFRRSFVPIVLITLWIVLLLSIRQIRRRLRPLELLRAGTKNIAQRDFSSRVEVSSRDEFEELAGSFNRMAHRLGVQFESLTTLSGIQSSLLSALRRHEVAEAMLSRLGGLLPCRSAQLTLFEGEEPARLTSYGWRPRGLDEPVSRRLDAGELGWLQQNREIRVVGRSEPLPTFLSRLRSRRIERVVVVPVVLEERVLGMIAAGVADDSAVGLEDLGPIRQLADQVAQALSKAALVEELEELSMGTLSALARTIDANSEWTAGHSERVARLAVRLGTAMGLPKDELDTLERGALLHDIGKIGVDSNVLNKPSQLGAEERRLVQRHVEIGAEILEPVPSLADTLPIVRQHHEWYDGSGYLRGLAGGEIHPLARLLAVVDSYDALCSPRPYRAAVDEHEVRRHLSRQAGTQFDPAVVEAFLRLLERDAAETYAGRRVRRAG